MLRASHLPTQRRPLARCHYRFALWLILGACLHAGSYSQSQFNNSGDDQQQLSQLVELAVKTHPSVQAKNAAISGNEASVESAKWQHFPSLSVQAERNTNPASGFASSNKTASVRLQQTLWSGGRFDAGLDNAQAKLDATRYALAEARNTVALRTIEAWQSWKMALGREQATIQYLAHLDRLSSMMERRVEQQISPAIEQQQLKTRIAQAKSELVAARSSEKSAYQRLLQWAGPDARTLLVNQTSDVHSRESSNQGKLAQIAQLPVDTAQQLTLAISRAPSVLRADAEIQASQAEVRQKQAEQWPSIYVRIDRQLSGGAALGGSRENVASVGLQYAPGAGLSVRSQIATALSTVNSLESEREALKRQILDTYVSEWQDYLSTTERIQLAQTVQSGNSALIESYTRLFVAGRRSWLELLNSLREENSSDLVLGDLLVQRKSNYFRLKLYLGQHSWQVSTQP